MYACMYVCIHVCMYVYVCMHPCVWACVCLRACMCGRVCVRACMHVCVYFIYTILCVCHLPITFGIACTHRRINKIADAYNVSLDSSSCMERNRILIYYHNRCTCSAFIYHLSTSIICFIEVKGRSTMGV